MHSAIPSILVGAQEHVKEAVAQACAPKAEEGAGSAMLQDIQPALEERILELRQELEPVLKEKIQALEQDLQSVLDQQPRCVTQAALEERLRLLKEHLEGIEGLAYPAYLPPSQLAGKWTKVGMMRSMLRLVIAIMKRMRHHFSLEMVTALSVYGLCLDTSQAPPLV